jgi:hypothetical protein
MVEYMVGLLVVGAFVLLALLYVADRLIKARARARRLRSLNDRLEAAAERVDQQQAARQQEARASAALTSVMPAIKRPPLSLPGMPAPGPSGGPGQPAQAQQSGDPD